MAKQESVKWTGKNLADVKKLHKGVAHYPEEEGQVFYRDASQHPDNLHLEVDGQTLVVAKGDTISKDAEGRITVEQTGERPTATGLRNEAGYQATGSESIKAKGRPK